ncbi:MAG: M10 family metallopeptidase C-terminal domain-containing protein, partial [Cyanobacteria bacterium SID2]|nr:M10 family metallopeptidase C-terminal domain-containing protein [Cyanobacteria bacterium SID2]
QSISIDVLGDTVFEPDETFFVDLSNVANADLADGQGIGTILNDDRPPGGDDEVGETPAPGGGDDGETPGPGGEDGDETPDSGSGDGDEIPGAGGGDGEAPGMGDEGSEAPAMEGDEDRELRIRSISSNPNAIVGTSEYDILTGSDGDDELMGLEGMDVLTGGAGLDRFVYTSLGDGLDLITDFTLGEDQIDISRLGISPEDIRFTDTPFGTLATMSDGGMEWNPLHLSALVQGSGVTAETLNDPENFIW